MSGLKSKLVIPATVLLTAPRAFGHGGEGGVQPHDWHELWQSWSFEPWIIGPLFVTALLYGAGVLRLWRATQPGRGIGSFELACFSCGWLTLFIAVVSPLHPWGRVLFSAHMTQHELLMLIAAPLLVLGRPVLAFLSAFPRRVAGALSRAANQPAWQAVWKTITNLFVAWAIHGVALWVWHIPSLFDATIDNELVHAFQHISFLGSALLFWWALLHGRKRAQGYGLAVLYMFTTAMHSGLLGALLTFANSLWYSAYANTTQWWGLTPVEDQQLGGLIMWVPAGLVYVLSALIFFVGWLRESEQRALAREKDLRGATA